MQIVESISGDMKLKRESRPLALHFGTAFELVIRATADNP